MRSITRWQHHLLLVGVQQAALQEQYLHYPYLEMEHTVYLPGMLLSWEGVLVQA